MTRMERSDALGTRKRLATVLGQLNESKSDVEKHIYTTNCAI